MYIYKTTCLLNGKIYIGQSSKTPEESKGYLGSGNNIKHAIKKYGKENFKKEILKNDLNDLKSLDKWELIFIVKYKSHINGYNIVKGSTNNFTKHPMQIPEVIEKFKRSYKNTLWNTKKGIVLRINSKIRARKQCVGKNNPNYNNKWTEEQKKRLSEKMKGRYVGSNNPNYNNKWNDVQRKNLSKKKSRILIRYDKYTGNKILFKNSNDAALKTETSRGNITGNAYKNGKAGFLKYCDTLGKYGFIYAKDFKNKGN